jgi:hypothetical protein
MPTHTKSCKAACASGDHLKRGALLGTLRRVTIWGRQGARGGRGSQRRGDAGGSHRCFHAHACCFSLGTCMPLRFLFCLFLIFFVAAPQHMLYVHAHVFFVGKHVRVGVCGVVGINIHR